MKMCRNPDTLIRGDRVCLGNIQSAAESFFNEHMTLLFWVALLVMGLLLYVGNRPVRDDNTNYQLQNMNNGMRQK